jgi:hypothetical protein
VARERRALYRSLGLRPDAARPDAARPDAARPEADPAPEVAAQPAAAVCTPQDLTLVLGHLGRPGLDRFPANDAMIDGIGRSMAAGRPLSEGERNFMLHQLTEARLMNGGTSYPDAHGAALLTHPPARHYTPEVIDRLPELFNDNWRRAWGMQPR